MTDSRLGPVACGLNLLTYQQIARALGCCVEPVRRTGELRFRHPALAQTVRVNGRRKDASRALSAWLNRVRNASAAAIPTATL